ncbi:MAG: rhomboid family intramembrane serine protease [Prevotella sp.]|nr:rhomboid family intramembrane serine protease [Prevotella sp.]MBQ8701797.1 rhomboid family intramembrane serine protease [Prevotella sp.]
MRSIPAITKNLLIINVLAFFATFAFNRIGVDIMDLLGLHFFLASDFHIYQLFTYMFMHANLEHLFFNMFALWMFGCVVENAWGPKKFLFYYISCGLGAGFIQEIAQFFSFYMLVSSQFPDASFTELGIIAHNSATVLNAWTTVGASGAIYAILLAFGMIYPEERIFIFPLPIPIKAKWFVCGYVVIELLSALATTNDSVAHFAHLGGMLFGYLMIRHWNNNRSDGDNWEKHFRMPFGNRSKKNDGRTGNADWDYNARKKSKQEEVDRILDKIRKSGYDSLTEKEKKTLFENNR